MRDVIQSASRQSEDPGHKIITPLHSVRDSYSSYPSPPTTAPEYYSEVQKQGKEVPRVQNRVPAPPEFFVNNIS
ncbi:hypothetical protein AYI68_g6244 [Smittium mucronatum]|uniref:Uncharacterized protein n=1 Tax=Smittium mucronatum TaxID=133383 RepID=A0A1R0GS06_9FUNG|nr:hypothetical protein AYI68_g6244 [Smittium mucronatum]